MKRVTIAVVMVMVVGAACATVRGRDPIMRDALALRVSGNASAEQFGSRLKQGGYEFALVSTDRDSAWLASAATSAGLQITRPGRVGGAHYVFFGPKPLGDTTHTVPVQGGGQVRLHDALYQLDKSRTLDLILARFDSVTDLTRATRALMTYVGSDVSNNAALLLAIEAPSVQAGDTIARSLRAYLAETRECTGGENTGGSTLRLFFGPATRVQCTRAQVLNETGNPVSAQFVLP
ncbi:MAG TPA: hypothetical protein VGC44_02405 [Longimicrobiales bacterium]